MQMFQIASVEQTTTTRRVKLSISQNELPETPISPRNLLSASKETLELSVASDWIESSRGEEPVLTGTSTPM